MRIISRDQAQDKLKKYIVKLKRELADLNQSTGGSSGMMENIEELGGAMRERGKRARRHLADKAHKVHNKAKENPAATFVIAAGIGFLAALFMRRF